MCLFQSLIIQIILKKRCYIRIENCYGTFSCCLILIYFCCILSYFIIFFYRIYFIFMYWAGIYLFLYFAFMLYCTSAKPWQIQGIFLLFSVPSIIRSLSESCICSVFLKSMWFSALNRAVTLSSNRTIAIVLFAGEKSYWWCRAGFQFTFNYYKDLSVLLLSSFVYCLFIF